MVAPPRRGKRLTPRTAGEWAAVLPQYVGMAGLLAMLAFYFFTRQTEPALLTTFGGLIVVGQGAEAVSALKQSSGGESGTLRARPELDGEVPDVKGHED